MNGIKHDTSAPYKCASNGQAERAVQIKNGLSHVKVRSGQVWEHAPEQCVAASTNDVKEGSIQSRPARVLLNDHTRHIKPPVAQLLSF